MSETISYNLSYKKIVVKVVILFVILEKFTFTKHAYNPNVFIKPTTYSQSLNCMYIHQFMLSIINSTPLVFETF